MFLLKRLSVEKLPEVKPHFSLQTVYSGLQLLKSTLSHIYHLNFYHLNFFKYFSSDTAAEDPDITKDVCTIQ